MSPEQFQDALNYLDDDLIEQTDELRQGRRVPQTRTSVRKIMSWVAPAACLALAVGLAPHLLPVMESGSTANGMDAEMLQEAEQPPKDLQDQVFYEGAEANMQASRSEYTLQGVSCGDIYMEIPKTWTCEIQSGEDGSYFLVIRPPYETGSVRVGYWPGFGVCGTGLTEKQTTIAGMDATMGCYDGKTDWSFIAFRVEGDNYVVMKDGAETWWGAHGEVFMECLETLVIGEKE